jgi:hypothetical protein
LLFEAISMADGGYLVVLALGAAALFLPTMVAERWLGEATPVGMGEYAVPTGGTTSCHDISGS